MIVEYLVCRCSAIMWMLPIQKQNQRINIMTYSWMLCSYDDTYAIVLCTDGRKTHRGNGGSSFCSSGCGQKLT
jgi:hypothetical protein